MIEKICSIESLAFGAYNTRRPPGATLILTNGCFDILHAGHIRYLEACHSLSVPTKGLPKWLIVALNTDESVRYLKGDTRPINPWEDRAAVLAALTAVTFIVPLPEPTVTHMIHAIRPAIWAKGGDYSMEKLNREEVVAANDCGAVIKLLPSTPHSTTKVLQELANERPTETIERGITWTSPAAVPCWPIR